MQVKDCGNGTAAHVDLPDGRIIHVVPLTFGRWRITLDYDCTFVNEYWCLSDGVTRIRAIAEAANWDGSGDPLIQWNRTNHNTMGHHYRRRTNGDPATEVFSDDEH